MPRKFRQLFRVQGMTARVYRRQSNAGNYNYEIRLRTHGYNIYASSNNLEEAKRKFIDKLVEYEKYGDTRSNVPQTFVKFTEYFFDNFYSRKVAAETLRVAKSQFKNHLSPYFGDVPIRRIVPKKCQELYDGLEEQGKGKTAEEVFSLLNVIFKAAIKHAIITHNPLDMVFHTKHEREHGTALTKDEERKLLTETAGTPYQLMFAVGLYTGMRPNEYFTAKIEGD
ncbi:MAG: phage integrase central domain-containing protein, partial [Ruminococcus sp.]